MKQVIALHCPQCRQYQKLIFLKQPTLICSNCSKVWGQVNNPEDIFDQCPICQCRQFYVGKTFNQFYGCVLLIAAILLVPVTYGLSIVVLALLDWLLFKRIPSAINCYRCGTEFQNFETEKRFKPFMHHIGLKYDKYR